MGFVRKFSKLFVRGMITFPRRFRLCRPRRVNKCLPWTVAFLFVLPIAAAQEPPQVEVRQQLGGMSTGAAHAPVKDALSRPITAGGFVDAAPVIFTDVTHAAGLDKFHHKAGDPDKRTILETPGSGVALLD